MGNTPKNKLPITITEPALLLRINQKYQDNLTENELYRTTQGEWVIGKRRQNARYAFAVYKGIVLQVYKIQRWVPYAGKNTSIRQRWCFEGVIAKDLQQYVGGDVRHYFTRGNRNPVLFINC